MKNAAVWGKFGKQFPQGGIFPWVNNTRVWRVVLKGDSSRTAGSLVLHMNQTGTKV